MCLLTNRNKENKRRKRYPSNVNECVEEYLEWNNARVSCMKKDKKDEKITFVQKD